MRVVSAINLMKNARPRSGFGADYRPASAIGRHLTLPQISTARTSGVAVS